MSWPAVVAIGVGVGFLSGLVGKGGSAVATPLLHAAGVPAFVAVAAPLPAAIPSTVAASAAYWRARLIDWEVLGWSLAIGVPATVAGAVATRWIGVAMLVTTTDILVAGLGVRLLLRPGEGRDIVLRPGHYGTRLALVALGVGILSGLLANSGGFLLAPLYMAVLRLPVKNSLATSLAVATALAVPGTVVHAALGHIDWKLVAVYVAAATPLSYLGARVGLRMNGHCLERLYGAALLLLGAGFLLAAA